MVRNRIFYSEIRSIEKDGNTQLIPGQDIFYVYKLFPFDIWKQFYIMSENIEISLTPYLFFFRDVPVFINGPYLCYIFYFLYHVQLDELPSSDVNTGSGSIYCRIK